MLLLLNPITGSGEKENVYEQYPEIVSFLGDKLNEIIDSNKLVNVDSQKTESFEINKSLKDQLKSLGYL